MYLKEALDDLYVCVANAKNATLEEGYYEKCYDRIIEEIEKQDTEINKLNNVIDRMAEKINQAYFDKENMYKWFEEEILPKDEFGLCEYKDLGTRKKLIKEYFMKEDK